MYTNRYIWNISFPIFLSLLAQNVINVTDTAFLGRVGQVELGASAIGGLFYICIFTIAFGFSTGSQILIGRRNGEQNYQAIGPIVIQGGIFLFVMAVIVFGLSRLFAWAMMRLMISSDDIWNATMDFLDWRMYGFFFSFINVIFRALFVGITRTTVLIFNAVFMALTNIVLDYLLIFGHAGFPEMGIQGAAIASVIAEAVSILFFIIYSLLTVDRKKYGFDPFKSFDFQLLLQVLNISVFMMLQYFVSMSTFLMFFIIVERLGEHELAIANIVRSIYIVMFIPVNSLSTATNTMVSNLMGMKKTFQVIPLIKKVTGISLSVMLVCSTFLCLFPDLFLSIYTNDELLKADSVQSLYVIAVAILICSVASIVFSGLSGTGNTRSAFAIEIGVLVIYVSVIYMLGIHYRMPVQICFFGEWIYFALLLIGCVLYFRMAPWYKKKI